MRTISRFLILATLLTVRLTAQPFPLATPPVGPTPGNVLGGAAASNGNLYLAAWSELRSGVVQIRGIHVRTDGVPVEKASFRLSLPTEAAGEGLISRPAVASDGTSFVVVWASKSRLYTAWIPPSSEIRVLATAIDARAVWMAWGGTSYVVLRETSAGTLAATLIDFDGTLLREGVTVAAPPGGVAAPGIAANRNGRTLAFWLEPANGDAHVADVSVANIFSGGINQTALQSPRPVYQQGTIGSDGTGFLAAWTIYPVNPLAADFSTVSRRLDSNGLRDGPVQTVAAAASPLVHPLLFWNGEKYLLIDSKGVVTARPLNPDGTPAPPGEYVITTHSGSSKDAEALIAGDLEGSTKTFLLWRDFRFGQGELFGQAGGLDALPTSDEIVVSRSPANQSVGGAVWTGSDYLTVWTEKAGVSQIVAARANERVPIVIAGPQLTASTPGEATVAAANGRAVIAWIDVPAPGGQQTTLYRATLVNGDQAASRPFNITTDVKNETPSIATNGQTFALAWTTRAGEIAATTIDSSGSSNGVPVTLTVKPSDTLSYGSPRLAWSGSSYVLVRQRIFNDGRTILEFQRLSAGLTLIGGPAALTDTGTPASVSVAGSPSGVLVTWVQRSSGGTSVRAARISATNLTDPINGITLLPFEPRFGPAAGWDGRNWRIGINNVLMTLPAAGAVQFVETVPLATRIGAIAGGGPRTFIAFDVEDRAEVDLRVYGQFLIDPPARRRAVR